MRRFRFALETILRHRQRLENERAGELAQATQARLAAQGALADLDAQEARSFEQQAELLASGAFSALDLEGFVRFRQGLASRRVGLQKDLDLALQVEDQARRFLVEARKEREVLEKLKQNKFEAWLKELDAAEARLMDELATQAYARPEAD